MSQWSEIKKHLCSRDEVMALLIQKHGKPSFLDSSGLEVNLFDSVINSIISQQLSIHAARSIRNKLYDLGNIQEFNIEFFINSSIEDLRSCGLSRSKCLSMKSLSHTVDQIPDFLTSLNKKSDEDVIEQLTKIKGIGIWTAQMFQMFALRKLDVFALKDAGLMKGVRIAYFKGQKPDENQVINITDKWRPYRSIGSWYMWKIANNPPLTDKIV